MNCTISSPLAEQTIAILNRQLRQRNCAEVTLVDQLEPRATGLVLTVDPQLESEAFMIQMIHPGRLEIAGT